MCASISAKRSAARLVLNSMVRFTEMSSPACVSVMKPLEQRYRLGYRRDGRHRVDGRHRGSKPGARPTRQKAGARQTAWPGGYRVRVRTGVRALERDGTTSYAVVPCVHPRLASLLGEY